MRHWILRGLWALCLVGGFGCTSYGVLRESFADLAVTTGFGEEGFGEGGFGGGLSAAENRFVEIGVALCLLPSGRELHVEDRRRNAAYAILGFCLLAAYTVREVVRLLREP